MNKEDLTRSPRPKKKRILVVEDQDGKRNLLKLALGEYDVAAVGDYDTALRMAKRQYFDLYVLDNQIPSGTGIELCRRIREFDPNTPILYCSGSVDSSEALGAGAQAYFAKPIVVQKVLWAVTELLSTSAQGLSEARHAEYVAIREELGLRFSEIRQSKEMAAEKKQRALRKILRLKAKMAFLNAGGMRGDFARLWPSTYLDAALNWECAKRERAEDDQVND
jgi:DNA-binding response OmpR family regulator